MGVVVFFLNPFDPSQREARRTRRPMTVRRFVSRGLRRHTVSRTIDGRKVRGFTRPTVCRFNGAPLMRRDWNRTIGDGDIVTFHTLPAGGDAGILQVVMVFAMIAIMFVAPYLAGALAPFLGVAVTAAGTAAGLAGSILTAVVGMTLSAGLYGLMSVLTPPPPGGGPGNAGSGYGGTPQSSPTYSFGAQGNSARLGQPIPVLYGRHMVYPDFVGEPYTRFVDNKQFIHMILGVTEGECAIEQVRIGDTPVESFKSIVWAKLEPGEEPDTEIVDPRWLVCRDIADVELLGAEADPASPWAGPYAANPAGTIVGTIEADFIAPRGLFKSNSGGTFDTMEATVEIQVQEIDDDGQALDEWTTIDTVTKSAADSAPQRYTETYEVAEGRWQLRVRRTDSKDPSAYAGHEIHWIGLRGRIIEQRSFGGMTCLQIRMEATGDLNGQTSRQVNVIATRMLPTWDDELGGMTPGAVETRNPIDALADIERNTDYGGGTADSKIDLATMYSHWHELERDGWTFDFVFDQTVLRHEALNRVARATNGLALAQGGKIRLARNLPGEAAVTMFTPRTIKPGSLKLEYKMVDDQTADALTGIYMSETSWKPVPLTVAFADSAQARPSTVKLEGVTQRDQARAMLWNMMRANRYQRKLSAWETESEGLPLLYGDRVSLSHDVPRWGQSAEIVEWDEDTRTATLTEALEFTLGATHYVALRKPNNTLAGPFPATAGEAPNQVVIGAGDLPAIYTGGEAERTLLQFGPGEAYAKRLIVIQMRPRNEREAVVLAIDDDVRMFDELPDETDVPIGTPAPPVAVTIAANASNVNLRTVADAAGYIGSRGQTVVITNAAGSTLTSTDALTPAVVRGSWPFGFRPKLINQGAIHGADGAPGAGGIGGTQTPYVSGDGAPGAPGVKGGTALDTSSGDLELDNSAGVLRAGKAGGGGGGGGGGVSGSFQMKGGDGGTGNGGVGSPGATDGIDAAGAGGNGGAQGNYGIAGTAGANGSAAAGGAGGAGGTGGTGGAAGRAINGVAKVTFVGSPGTITGLQV